jgi:hypothetical protein
MHLPSHIVARIQGAIAAGGHGYGIDREAATHGAIALMGTLGSIWMLRPDGSLWDADQEFDKPLTPLADNLHTMALVYGVKRYPWLSELLPERPVDSADCEACQGKGQVLVEGSIPPGMGILCQRCNGLGWEA